MIEIEYLIRTEILNLTIIQWRKIHDIKNDGIIKVTVSGLHSLIGFGGGMFFSNKANVKESEFIEKFYNYGRKTYV